MMNKAAGLDMIAQLSLLDVYKFHVKNALTKYLHGCQNKCRSFLYVTDQMRNRATGGMGYFWESTSFYAEAVFTFLAQVGSVTFQSISHRRFFFIVHDVTDSLTGSASVTGRWIDVTMTTRIDWQLKMESSQTSMLNSIHVLYILLTPLIVLCELANTND